MVCVCVCLCFSQNRVDFMCLRNRVITHRELRQHRGDADGGQENVVPKFLASQSAEKVVPEVGGGGAHLGLRRGEKLDMFLLRRSLLGLGL